MAVKTSRVRTAAMKENTRPRTNRPTSTVATTVIRVRIDQPLPKPSGRILSGMPGHHGDGRSTDEFVFRRSERFDQFRERREDLPDLFPNVYRDHGKGFR